MNISHLQWEFPLDRSVDLNIYASTLKVLFRTKHITLPVFQRKYCWTTSQFKLLWEDLNALHGSFKKDKHHIGKLTVFENGDEIIVIDGQQRITTVMIIFMSIRDAFIRINESRKSRQIHKLIDKINSILFNSKHHPLNPNDPKESDEKTKEENPTSTTVQEGDRLQYIRFLPTYLDREPFYNLVLRTNAFSEYLEMTKGTKQSQPSEMNHFGNSPNHQSTENPESATSTKTKQSKQSKHDIMASSSPTESVSESDHKDNNNNDNNNESDVVVPVVNIYESKKYFDDRVSALCRSGSLNRLVVLCSDLLNKLTFVYCGIPNECFNKGFFIYQWLFEKQFLASTLLINKRPGEHHLPCELFKNYILSFFIALNVEEQEKVYLQWNAMEKRFNSMLEFNAFLILVENVKSDKHPSEYWLYKELVLKIEKRLKNVEEEEYPQSIQLYLNEMEMKIDAVQNGTDDDRKEEEDDGDDTKEIEDENESDDDDDDDLDGLNLESLDETREITVIDNDRKERWEKIREMAKDNQLSIVQETTK